MNPSKPLLLGGSATRCAQAEGRLEGVVDPPLETSQGTDHEDTGWETLGQQIEGTKLGCNCAQAYNTSS
jgi:hypothetical protein